MKIYLCCDDNGKVKRAYTSESLAIDFSAGRPIGKTELFLSHHAGRGLPIGNVDELMGAGAGMACMIWGAGPSAATFDHDRIPDDVTMHLSANLRWPNDLIDYNFYTDEKYAQWLKSGIIKLPDTIEHIAQEGAAPASYWFFFRDRSVAGHTGKTALYIADKVMRFDKIYLIGYDYCLGENGELHANEPDGICNQGDCDEHRERIFRCQLEQFETVDWTPNTIFNLNKCSALKKFPFYP